MPAEHTIVVRFKDEGPRYHKDMMFEGGQVVAVAFDGNRLTVEETLLEALEKLLDVAETEIACPDDIPEITAARDAVRRATYDLNPTGD